MNGHDILVFGPVPSRRLGRSLGINNIPPKTCSYSCVYCQLGKTDNLIIERKNFYNPEDILAQVRMKVEEFKLINEKIDYLTFVPDGEPTLDLNLGKEISLLKNIGIKIAIISNSSLLWREDVVKDLLKADLVSIKIDAVSRDLWKKINRPHKKLNLEFILEGIKNFSKLFKGKIISETMLINNVNYKEEIINIADFLDDLEGLDMAYIAIPTRPPTERWVRPADEETVNASFQIFSDRVGFEKVGLLIGYEGNSFSFTKNVKEDLLSILAVHPMREEAIKNLLNRANSSWQLIEDLLNDELIIKVGYEGKTYYMRKFKR